MLNFFLSHIVQAVCIYLCSLFVHAPWADPYWWPECLSYFDSHGISTEQPCFVIFSKCLALNFQDTREIQILARFTL